MMVHSSFTTERLVSARQNFRATKRIRHEVTKTLRFATFLVTLSALRVFAQSPKSFDRRAHFLIPCLLLLSSTQHGRAGERGQETAQETLEGRRRADY